MGFDAFDPDKKEVIKNDMAGTILSMMGMKIPSEQLSAVISEFDPFGALRRNLLKFNLKAFFGSVLLEASRIHAKVCATRIFN